MNTREVVVLTAISAMAIVLGVAPGIFMERIEPSAQRFVVNLVHKRAGRPYQADPGELRMITEARVQQSPTLKALPMVNPLNNPRVRIMDPSMQKRIDRLDDGTQPMQPAQPVVRPKEE